VFTGKVVGITDGDTVKVLRDNQTVKVRLSGIDTPEMDQPFGKQSKRFISKLIFGKTVDVKDLGLDRYKRTLGYITEGSTEVNEAIVAAGLAWHYVKYSDDQKLAEAEKKARAAKRGLWADPESMPPWDWRRLSKEEKAREKGIAPSSSPEEEFDFSRPRPPSVGGNPNLAPPSGSGSKAAMSYWITTKSGKRHNSGCRWYEKSKGRACTATEGVACKICGG
jgi:endonuclease YncB( thermonuclease family)